MEVRRGGFSLGWIKLRKRNNVEDKRNGWIILCNELEHKFRAKWEHLTPIYTLEYFHVYFISATFNYHVLVPNTNYNAINKILQQMDIYTGLVFTTMNFSTYKKLKAWPYCLDLVVELFVRLVLTQVFKIKLIIKQCYSHINSENGLSQFEGPLCITKYWLVGDSIISSAALIAF